MQVLTQTHMQATVGGFLGGSYVSSLPSVPTLDHISRWLQRIVQQYLAHQHTS